MPQVPFSAVPVGARFRASVSILGDQDIDLKKASECEAIPAYGNVNGWPVFKNEDADLFGPNEVVTWPPSDIWAG